MAQSPLSQSQVLIAALALTAAALAQPPGPAVVAGIPVNYDEAKVGNHPLPDPLKMANGTKVHSAKDWESKRRPELIRLFEDHQFGHIPALPPPKPSFFVFERSGSAFDGKAIRRQVTIRFGEGDSAPKGDVLLYLPQKATTKPVPVLLQISFSANSTLVDDPGVKPGETWDRDHKRVPAAKRPSGTPAWDVLPWIEKGIAVATIYYGDIEPDFDGGRKIGVRGLYPDDANWGGIAGWSWGLSRVVDYLETDNQIDARRIALFGVSRLGKTALWAGAVDRRFSLVIASCSGEGGASLSRRDYGETIAHLGARFLYWFTPSYKEWGSKVADFPVDAHELISLIAPRPLLLQTGDKDYWADPKGEFLAAKAAEPVYKLLGAPVSLPAAWPDSGRPFYGSLGYFMHSGGHGPLPADWEIFLKFVDMHFKP